MHIHIAKKEKKNLKMMTLLKLSRIFDSGELSGQLYKERVEMDQHMQYAISLN